MKSVTHGQWDARPTVTFPAKNHHRPLINTKLYCLLTETHVSEQLAQGCYLKAERPAVEPVTFLVASPTPETITPPCHGPHPNPYLIIK